MSFSVQASSSYSSITIPMCQHPVILSPGIKYPKFHNKMPTQKVSCMCFLEWRPWLMHPQFHLHLPSQCGDAKKCESNIQTHGKHIGVQTILRATNTDLFNESQFQRVSCDILLSQQLRIKQGTWQKYAQRKVSTTICHAVHKTMIQWTSRVVNLTFATCCCNMLTVNMYSLDPIVRGVYIHPATPVPSL